MGTNLNEDVCFRQVKGRVSDFGDKNSVDLWVMLEVLNNLEALRLARGAVDKRLPHPVGVVLEGKDIVRKLQNN